MTNPRYSFIRYHFRLTSYIKNSEDVKVNNVKEKTNNIVRAVNKLFTANYSLGQNITIDESTISFKANVLLKYTILLNQTNGVCM